jgi:hypothetical protein
VPRLGIIPDRRSGTRLHLRTVFRWALEGVRGCRLETILVGGQRMTSQPAVQRFFEAVSAAAGSVRTTNGPTGVPSKARGDVEADLDQLGI